MVEVIELFIVLVVEWFMLRKVLMFRIISRFVFGMLNWCSVVVIIISEVCGMLVMFLEVSISISIMVIWVEMGMWML